MLSEIYSQKCRETSHISEEREMSLPYNLPQIAVYLEVPVEPRFGSHACFATITASRKLVVIPTPYQRSVAVGTILGDSYLTKNKSLQVEHSTQQASYVGWKHSVFTDVAGKISDVSRIHPKTGVGSVSKRFYTNKSFQDLEPLFYKVEGNKRRKVIPPGIGDLLDPVSLAVWYMDDGGKAQNTPKGAYINVSNFSEPERELLRDSVNMVFELKTRLHKAGGNNQWNIYVPAESYDKFIEIVSPTVSQIPEMIYKIGG
uniref:ORF236 n=1 Tax=Pseudococcomyxa simplex TaxID=464287 RepID=A0A0Y0C5S2_9CHLO|nr:ORF236 [Pseudococcomyxa simplex]